MVAENIKRENVNKIHFSSDFFVIIDDCAI
jgi:hypothetical protein